ncbi:hypothetical protein BKA62DRAFT_720085 [Auriculariales sp. MPI-PUGE-AT-0066]|nr:hypothetical protein BKA62DRAFT_720085 [Auriculariales sp. MPI-PUGE-AT-0066]
MGKPFLEAPAHFFRPEDCDTPHDYGQQHAVSKYVNRANLHFYELPFPNSLKAEDIAEWLRIVSRVSFMDVAGFPLFSVWPLSSMSFPRLTGLRKNTVCLESANLDFWDPDIARQNDKSSARARLSLPRLRILAISGFTGSFENLFAVVVRSSILTLQSLSMDVEYPRVVVALDQPNRIEHLRLCAPFYITGNGNILKQAVRIIRTCAHVRHLDLDGYNSVVVSMILSSILQPLQSLAISAHDPLPPGILTESSCTRTLRVFAAPISLHPTLQREYSRVGRRIQVIDYKRPRLHGYSNHMAWFGSRFHRGTNEPWATDRRDPRNKDSGDTWCNSRLFSILCSCRTTDS